MTNSCIYCILLSFTESDNTERPAWIFANMLKYKIGHLISFYRVITFSTSVINAISDIDIERLMNERQMTSSFMEHSAAQRQGEAYHEIAIPIVVNNVIELDRKIDLLEEQLRINVARIDEYRGILHTRRHLAASPIFKGIPNFRQTRIAMLRAETVSELVDILEQCRKVLN